ncbi:MAG: hypothetical protein A3K19_14020 [Lentisphaerae bacterium RIFOXYB12_FULL_65_16]|nr:MAG: hypothetical protein A3K18_26020 [Lentisphaerae bacterium RIFOXYA12_64_32]OGV88230.1 MAG: hypothetical protein A3K19_14020 [Lentisphaerae bacterium RIFOXYB12_FULL_65_16]
MEFTLHTFELELKDIGRVVGGDPAAIRRAVDEWSALPVDMRFFPENREPPAMYQTRLNGPISACGPATYTDGMTRTLHFEPAEDEGWWFIRRDQKDQLPIRVSIRNVWDTNRSIVLRSGGPHNYMRMIEHIVALRLGLGLDNLNVVVDSGDPPLFDEGSLDLVRAVEKAGIVEDKTRLLTWWTVKEPVTLGGSRGDFLTILPAERGLRTLLADCAVNFPNALGRQRIQFDLCRETFRHGACARTNCSQALMLYCKTIGKIFADIRNLGYNHNNILIAGKTRYVNTPRLIHEGKSLEAAWHRAMLDLVAALSLIETGRLAGTVISYKAGHALDVRMVTRLYQEKLLVPLG